MGRLVLSWLPASVLMSVYTSHKCLPHMEGDVDHRVRPVSLRVEAWHAHYFPLTSLRSIPTLSVLLCHGRLVPWPAGFQLGFDQWEMVAGGQAAGGHRA